MTKKVTVLAVDDEPRQADLLRRVLERAGYRVYSAVSTDEAVGIFDAHADEIDLLVTDVVMPGLDGPSLAQRLKAAKPRLRVLFVSGFLAQYEWIARSGHKDSERFLAKPFSASLLIEEVKKTLGSGKKHTRG